MSDAAERKKPFDRTNPCYDEHCDKCYPVPRWKISEHRIQHVTYKREIKAATKEEAMQIFGAGTAWPSSYDDWPGAVVEQDEPVVELLPPRDYCLSNDGDLEAFLEKEKEKEKES